MLALKCLLCLPLRTALDHVTLVDPDLHADTAEGGPGLVESVVDVGAQRVQGHPAFAVELRAAHLCPAQASGTLHPDALGAALHRRLHGLAHRPPEADPARQLLRHALRDELGVDLRVLHLEDVELDLLAGQLLEVAADAVGLGAPTSDDDPRAGGVDVHPQPALGPLDVDPTDSRALHAPGHHLTDLHILAHIRLVLLVGVPTRGELRSDPEPEPVRVDLLPHYRALLAVCDAPVDAPRVTETGSRLSTTTVMWLVRFRIRYARPCARGRMRLSVGPSST